MENNNTYIMEIQIESVKGLTHFKVENLSNRVNAVVGKNGKGKTSVLEAVNFALTGNEESEIINVNSNKAESLIKLSDGIRVKRTKTRKFTEDGKAKNTTRLEIYKENEGGEVVPILNHYNQPFKDQAETQQYVSNLFGFTQINISKHLNDDAKKRQEALLEALQLKMDLTTFFAQDTQLKEQKSFIDAKLKDDKSVYESISVEDALIEEEVDVVAVSEELQSTQQKKQDILERKKTIALCQVNVSHDEEAIKDLQSQIDAKKRNITSIRDKILHEEEELIKQEKNFNETLESLLREKLASAQSINARVVQNKAKTEQKNSLATKIAIATAEAEDVKEKRKSKLLAFQEKVKIATSMITGLTCEIKEYDKKNPDLLFFFNGKPLESLSKSEQIMFCVKLKTFNNPQMKICLIDDGESLDTDTEKELFELMQQNDMQCFISFVDNGRKMEDERKIIMMETVTEPESLL